MDAIDITDSTFSLDTPSSNKILHSAVGGCSLDNYMTYIYIGIAALIVLGGVYIFKMYQNRTNYNSNESSMNCPVGFCMPNQNQNPNQNPNQNVQF